MRGSLVLLAGLVPGLFGLGCNLIADIQEGEPIGTGTAGTGGAAGAAGATPGGGGAGGTGGAVPQGGGPACAAPRSGNACDECLFTACQDEYCACANGSDCQAILECQAKGNILEYCWLNNTEGISSAGSRQVCGSQACPECQFAPVDDCLACEYERCPDEVNACFSKGSCTAYLACLSDCKANGGTDVTCGNMCYGDGDGVAEASKLVDCSKSACTDVCAP